MNPPSRRISVPIAVLVATYAVALGIWSLSTNRLVLPTVTGELLFVILYVMIICVRRGRRLPAGFAAATLGAVAVLPFLAEFGVDPSRASYLTGAWHAAAIGCLALILIVRGRPWYALVSAAILTVQTVAWGGAYGGLRLGVGAIVIVVLVLAIGYRAITLTTDAVAQFVAAERADIERQALRVAQHNERLVRFGATMRSAGSMLRQIVQLEGQLDSAQRNECRILEQTIRDEIRGRVLLNDSVREQVLIARQRGAFVQVLDDGGLDDIDPFHLTIVLEKVADALKSARSDRIIIRTSDKASKKAVTVVAISADPTATALGIEREQDEVDLWLEIDRPFTEPGGQRDIRSPAAFGWA